MKQFVAGAAAAVLSVSAAFSGPLEDGSAAYHRGDYTTGAEADIVLVLARTDSTHKTRGITAFVIETGSKGFTVGKKEDKLGLRASSTVQLILEDVRVPASQLLGELGSGFKIAMHTLDGGRIGIAAQAVGIAQACLDASVKYAGEREAFDQPIGKFQAIQFKIANMATRLEAARLLVYNAARLKDEGKPHGKEAAMEHAAHLKNADFAKTYQIKATGAIVR